MGRSAHTERSPVSPRRTGGTSTAAVFETSAPVASIAERGSRRVGQKTTRDAVGSNTPASSASGQIQRCGTQRQRLLDSISHLASRDSFDAVTVAEIVALAGVSRPSFYEHFTDKEDCFLAALAPLRHQLLADIAAAAADGRPEDAVHATTQVLLAFADSHPDAARLLISDPLAGGRRLLDARDELVAQAARPIEHSFALLTAGARACDLPPRLIVGVTCRLLAARSRQEEPCGAEILRELLQWLVSYELPTGDHPWRGAPHITQASGPSHHLTTLRAPPLAAGRRRVPEDVASEHQWLRIVFATAETVASEGYGASTVAQITRRAGVDGRAFYRLFACKEQALAAARELFFRHAMALTAGAFATGGDWPARVRAATAAFAICVEQNPALAYVSFVEAHAGGPVAMGRLRELICAFTIFLQEGYRYQPSGGRRLQTPPPSSLALEAIVTSVFELCYQQCREHAGRGLSEMAEHITFLCLAPFLGAANTGAPC